MWRLGTRKDFWASVEAMRGRVSPEPGRISLADIAIRPSILVLAFDPPLVTTLPRIVSVPARGRTTLSRPEGVPVVKRRTSATIAEVNVTASDTSTSASTESAARKGLVGKRRWRRGRSSIVEVRTGGERKISRVSSGTIQLKLPGRWGISVNPGRGRAWSQGRRRRRRWTTSPVKVSFSERTVSGGGWRRRTARIGRRSIRIERGTTSTWAKRRVSACKGRVEGAGRSSVLESGRRSGAITRCIARVVKWWIS